MCRRGPGQKPGLIRFRGIVLFPGDSRLLGWLIVPRQGDKDDQKNRYDENACHGPVPPSWVEMMRACAFEARASRILRIRTGNEISWGWLAVMNSCLG